MIGMIPWTTIFPGEFSRSWTLGVQLMLGQQAAWYLARPTGSARAWRKAFSQGLREGLGTLQGTVTTQCTCRAKP